MTRIISGFEIEDIFVEFRLHKARVYHKNYYECRENSICARYDRNFSWRVNAFQDYLATFCNKNEINNDEKLS